MAKQELEQVLSLLLYAAVKCERRDYFIHSIMTNLPVGVQEGIMLIIKKMTDDGANILNLDKYQSSAIELSNVIQGCLNQLEDMYVKEISDLIEENEMLEKQLSHCRSTTIGNGRHRRQLRQRRLRRAASVLTSSKDSNGDQWTRAKSVSSIKPNSSPSSPSISAASEDDEAPVNGNESGIESHLTDMVNGECFYCGGSDRQSPSNQIASRLTIELAQTKAKLRTVRVELDDRNDQLADAHDQLDSTRRELNKVKSDRARLVETAQSARHWQDEADALRESAGKAKDLEADNARLKSRLIEADYYKTRCLQLTNELDILDDNSSELINSDSNRIGQLEQELEKTRQRLAETEQLRSQDLDELFNLRQQLGRLDLEQAVRRQAVSNGLSSSDPSPPQLPTLSSQLTESTGLRDSCQSKEQVNEAIAIKVVNLVDVACQAADSPVDRKATSTDDSATDQTECLLPPTEQEHASARERVAQLEAKLEHQAKLHQTAFDDQRERLTQQHSLAIGRLERKLLLEQQTVQCLRNQLVSQQLLSKCHPTNGTTSQDKLAPNHNADRSPVRSNEANNESTHLVSGKATQSPVPDKTTDSSAQTKLIEELKQKISKLDDQNGTVDRQPNGRLEQHDPGQHSVLIDATARLKADNSTLMSQLKSVNSDNIALSARLKERENQLTTASTMFDLTRQSERQLNADYRNLQLLHEQLIRDYDALTASFKSLKASSRQTRCQLTESRRRNEELLENGCLVESGQELMMMMMDQNSLFSNTIYSVSRKDAPSHPHLLTASPRYGQLRCQLQALDEARERERLAREVSESRVWTVQRQLNSANKRIGQLEVELESLRPCQERKENNTLNNRQVNVDRLHLGSSSFPDTRVQRRTNQIHNPIGSGFSLYRNSNVTNGTMRKHQESQAFRGFLKKLVCSDASANSESMTAPPSQLNSHAVLNANKRPGDRLTTFDSVNSSSSSPSSFSSKQSTPPPQHHFPFKQLQRSTSSIVSPPTTLTRLKSAVRNSNSPIDNRRLPAIDRSEKEFCEIMVKSTFENPLINHGQSVSDISRLSSLTSRLSSSSRLSDSLAKSPSMLDRR